MIKKLSVATLLAIMVLFCESGYNSAEAAAVFLGRYDDGSPAYILTHSVVVFDYRPYRFACTIESDGVFLDYYFFSRTGRPYYRNTEGYEAYVFGGESPIAERIYRFVVNNY